MKAELNGWNGTFWWVLRMGNNIVAESLSYSRRRDAKRGLLRFLKGMKKGVRVEG